MYSLVLSLIDPKHLERWAQIEKSGMGLTEGSFCFVFGQETGRGSCTWMSHLTTTTATQWDNPDLNFRHCQLPWYLRVYPSFLFVASYIFHITLDLNRDRHAPLSQIRVSLTTSIGAGHVIFLAGIDATENKVTRIFHLSWFFCFLCALDDVRILTSSILRRFVQGGCVAVAALMQYFLMAAFCWMLVEGIYLFLFVVKVYNVEDKIYIYHVISWGKNRRQHNAFSYDLTW